MFFSVKNFRILPYFTLLLISATVLTSQVIGQTVIQWEKDLDRAKTRAILEKKPLLLHFYGDSCAPCQLMERDVFPHPQVVGKLNADFVAVKINVSQSPQLMSQYGVRGWPMDIFLSPTGERLHERVGMTSASQFLGELTSIAVKFPKPILVPQSQSYQTAQTPHHSGMTLAENNPLGVSQPINTGQATDFSGFSVAQSSPFQQPSQHLLDESEGYAVSGNSNVHQTGIHQASANVTSPLPQQQTTLGSIPIPQAVQSSVPQQFSPQQSMSQQNVVEQKFAATQLFQPTISQQQVPQPMVSQQVNPQQTVEPQPAQPVWNPSSWIASAPLDSPMASAGTFENGMIRKQPTPGMGAGNSLGVIAAVSVTSPMVQMPTIALDGYCPVSLAQTAQWVKGNAEITMEYDGILFRFVSVEARNAFANHPRLYAPVLHGNDAVELLTNRREVTGQRKFGAWYHGQVFLFTSAENYEKFQNNPELYAFQTQQPTNALSVARSPMN